MARRKISIDDRIEQQITDKIIKRQYRILLEMWYNKLLA